MIENGVSTLQLKHDNYINYVEAQRDIQSKVTCDLADAFLEGVLRPSFYLTSIYDHSIFEVD